MQLNRTFQAIIYTIHFCFFTQHLSYRSRPKLIRTFYGYQKTDVNTNILLFFCKYIHIVHRKHPNSIKKIQIILKFGPNVAYATTTPERQLNINIINPRVVFIVRKKLHLFVLTVSLQFNEELIFFLSCIKGTQNFLYSYCYFFSQ